MTDQYFSYKITDAAGVGKFLAVVYGAAAGEVTKPGGAGVQKCAGITQEDQLTQNRSVTVKKSGRTFAVAAGAIAYGDACDINAATGKLRSCQARYDDVTAGAAELVNVVGFAESAAAADGDIFELTINIHTKNTPVS